MAEKQKKGPPPKLIELEVEPVKKTPDGFETTVTAIVSTKTRERRALFGELVMFFVDNSQVGGIRSTDVNGRVSIPVPNLPADRRSVLIEAQIVGSGFRVPKIVELKEDKPKLPETIRVTQRRSDNRHDIVFQVLSAEGTAVPNAVIRIMDPMDPAADHKVYDLEPTKKDGTVQLVIEFKEQRRVLTAMVLGSKIVQKIFLFNPPNEMKGDSHVELVEKSV